MIRSAFAELYARHLGCPLPVSSAATTYRNPGIHPRTAAALAARGVAPDVLLSFRPRHLDDVAARLEPGTVALGMTAEHLDALRSYPLLAAGGFLLEQTHSGSNEIADPLFEGGWERAFERIAVCVEALVEELGRRGG